MAVKRWLGLGIFAGLMQGCMGNYGDYFLDASIPRVVTPSTQIAFVRTKWVNGKLLQTTFLDKQERVLEDFSYGRTNEKTLNRYAADNRIFTTHYYHSDSSPSGYVGVIESRFEYDKTGRIVRVVRNSATLNSVGTTRSPDSSVVYYSYKSTYDTVFSVQHALKPGIDLSTVININRWERNKQGQIERNLRLYVMQMPQESEPDTVYYHSQRFSYDPLGRRKLAWFEFMYLGQFYRPAGPDTIRYEYDRQGRVIREVHRYTTDKRNKREVDTTSLNQFDRRSVAENRKRFFEGDSIFHNNSKTNIVEYQYERFDPRKHLPLHVSQDVDY